MKTLVLLSLILLLKSCSGDSLKPSAITPEKQAQIYAGLTTAREKARCSGYFNRLDDFKTRVVAPEGVSSDGQANYVTYNGKKIAGYYDVGSDTLVLVDQPNLSQVTYNEAEHRILLFNNRAEYERTKSDAANSHPIIPECK